jgi:hypothetical protein
MLRKVSSIYFWTHQKSCDLGILKRFKSKLIGGLTISKSAVDAMLPTLAENLGKLRIGSNPAQRWHAPDPLAQQVELFS